MGSIFSSIGGIVGDVIGGNEQGSAIDSQKKAIKRLKSIDIEDYKSKARLGDKEKYINQLADLREADPELAAVRSAAVQNMLDIVSGKASPAQGILDDLVAEGKLQANDPRYRALEDELIGKAKSRLDEGATLPPEFQAELVRSGLETGGTVGTGTNRAGPLAQILGNKLGSAGLALRAANEAQAANLAGAAGALRANRLNILAGLLPAAQSERGQQFQEAGQGITTAQALAPSGGLTGEELLNLEEANRQLYNQQQLSLGGLSAARHLKRAGEAQSLGSDIGNLVGSVAGLGFGGGFGGSSILSGLFGGSTSLPNASGTGYIPITSGSLFSSSPGGRIGVGAGDAFQGFNSPSLAANYAKFLSANNGINPYF